MLQKKWHELPMDMQTEAVRPYYDSLRKKKGSLLSKFIFDRMMSAVMLILLSPVFLVVAVLIRLDSQGEVMFRQTRITQYGKEFRIFKFRTMVVHAERMGSQVTTKQDQRVTRIGKVLRKYRIDELPQLLNILQGDMSFVGTRPEVLRYVEFYTAEMKATFLLPAGVTSKASIAYKDEAQLLERSVDVDKTYTREVLPEKMKYNLAYLEDMNFLYDLKLMVKTIGEVLR